MLPFKKQILAKFFRGLLPIVIDVETSGLHSATDALLEISMVTLAMSAEGKFHPDQTFAYHVEPFFNARLDKEALAITGIDPFGPLRYALPEAQAIERLFAQVRQDLAKIGRYRAVLVGHNAWFDLSFLPAAVQRNDIKNVPFHKFTTFDTAGLSGVLLGETVLARAAKRARIYFDVTQAHSAIYDAERTAELFCYLLNRYANR